MRRRAIIILSATLILALTVILYLTGKGRKPLVADAYRSVAGNACFVVETIDLLSFFNSLTTGKGLFGELTKFEELTGFNDRLKFITDNLNKPEIREMTSGGHALISFYAPGNGKVRILLSMPVSGDIRNRHIRQALGSAGITNISESSFGKSTVLKVPYANNNDTVFLISESGLLLVSNSGSLLKNSFAAMESGTDIRNYHDFSKVLFASGHARDKIFVVFGNLPDVIKPVLSPLYRDSASSFANLASTGVGDLYINDDGVILSGFTESDNSSDLLHKYKSISPMEFETYRILPAGTALFETIIKPPSIREIRKDSTRKVTILASSIKEYLGDEITRAYIDVKENKTSENNVLIYELKNPVQAEHSFLVSLDNPSDISWFRPDDQINIPVYRISGPGLAASLCPEFPAHFSDSLITFYDKYMITGSSYKTIAKLLYDNLLNNTLANDLVYRDFETSLPTRSSYYFYFVPARIVDYLEGYLDEKIIRSLKSNRNSLNKIQAAGYQLASGSDMIYNSLSVKFKNSVSEESLSEWETLLDTTAGIKPFFFTNHLTGAKEIFVQDLKNNIYLINAAGRVLWKAPLSEKIIGNIYMIDFYRNGKYQMLFNGKSNLHLIDRNGNYVERYPVKLRSAATNSIALFDYDNNHNYRILVAGEDRNIYAYDKSGNVVKGWKPFRTAGAVRSQLSYFRVSGKDFIAASDESTIYLLDRYGNKRVGFREPVTRAEGSALKLNSGSEPFLLCSSNDGDIQHIYFDGNVKKFPIRKFTSRHSMDIFDIDGDGFDEFVFIDQGKLYLYDHNRTELFSRDLGSDRLEGPITFSFTSEDRKIGVFDAGKNQIYLLDKTGEIMDGFPLNGASMFSIGRLSDKNSWHLIVGGADRFLHNYLIGSGS